MSTQETALAVSKPEVAKLEPQASKQTRLAAFTPTNLTEAIALSKMIAASDLAPKDFKGKPANVLIAMQMGAEVGLAPMQSLQNIAVINGRPCLWGDAALGVVQVHPDYEWHKEGWDGTGEVRSAVFQIKRKGQEAHTARFSVADAKKAGLWGKSGTWQTYPDRMLQMRARGFGLRDKFADALRGLGIAEEVMDIAPDTSDAKKQRDIATLDVTSGISQLTPSREPNRGHDNTGLQRSPAPQKQDDVICAECRKVNGHEQSCSQFAKAQQDLKTSKPTTKVAGLVVEVKKKIKQANGEPYLVLEVVYPDNKQSTLYVWHQSMHPYLEASRDKTILCEISEQVGKQGKIYYQLEHLLEIQGQPFVNDKPATPVEMEMPTEEPW
jgi:hypothetical protein